MKACPDDAVALVCLPTAISPEDRAPHFALIATLFAERAQEREALPGGYAYRFPVEAIEAVARFVANERKCCPFLSFELSAPAAAGSLWLRMTGPEGTRAILDAELGVPGPRAKTAATTTCCASDTAELRRFSPSGHWAAAPGCRAAARSRGAT